jgi:Zn-dependent protease
MNGDFSVSLVALVVIILSLSLHEFGHAKFADMAGDPTPRSMGRVTLNPIAHLDPLGFLMICIMVFSGVGLGWGKPVMVRPDKMRNPRWDHFASVLAGPLMNFVLCFIACMVIRLFPIDLNSHFGIFISLLASLNAGLMMFNLIPLGPLDGHWLVGAFLPDPIRFQWYRFNQSIGSFVLLGIIFIPQLREAVLGNFVYGLADSLIRLFLGK